MIIIIFIIVVMTNSIPCNHFHLCIVLLSSRTLHMTPGVQESRQDHNKDEPKYQPVEDECDMLSN